jgi:nitrite reductase/ring-hydroxylating ferredoxin subunit
VGVNRNADRAAEPTEWTDAVAASEVRDGQLRRVDVEGQPVLLTRQGGRLLAIGAVCSHYRGPLEDGELDGSCVVCPWHGSEFDLADGSVVRGPATVPQQAYDVRAVGERIEVKARI